MPTLHWIGKEKVINHHMDVPFKVLEHAYGFAADASKGSATVQKEETKSGNKIIHGDNLEALKALLPEYEGKIKCIYIDPPYNTGNEGWVYNDNVNDPKIKKWLGEVVGKEAEDLTRHDKWLCMMYPRLKLLHKLLADDGAIFISIDDNEQANLKLICDEIFGGQNFVNNIIWQKKTGASDAVNIATVTEYILVYGKQISSLKFNHNFEAHDEKRYKYKDEYFDERGPFYYDNLDRGTLGYYESLDYPVKTPDGSYTFPNGRNIQFDDGWRWKWSEEKLLWGIDNGFIEVRKSKSKVSGWGIYYKIYLNVDNEGNKIIRSSPFKNTILDVLNTHASNEAKKIFGTTTLFSNPKPSDLIQKIIQIATDKNSLVLDSYAGSGTTAHAVLKMNKQDEGNRKYILVEMEEYSENITAERVKRVIKGYGTTEGTGGSFDFYELGQPLFNEDGKLNESVGVEKIRQYVWYTETQSGYKLEVMNDEINKTHNSSLITHHSYLGAHNDTAYYFHYEKDEVTTLDHAFLATMKTKAEQYVIYADNCLLTKDFMTKHHIIFKKIPRDVTKF